MKVKLTFTEPLLGTWPANPDIARDYVASKAPNPTTLREEIDALGVKEVVEERQTIFPTHRGRPCLYDYQIKGFFKDACGILARVKTRKSAKIKAYKKIIDGLIFVSPRYIPIDYVGVISDCQRPLRANTPQGERVALANSQELPAGSAITFEINCLDPAHEELVREWLDYGALRGIGQWRNSGKGRFTWEEIA